MDIIFILTQDCYYVAQYDDEVDKVTQYQRVLLSNIEKIEFGVPEQSFSFGRSNMKIEHSFRIFYRMPSEGKIARNKENKTYEHTIIVFYVYLDPDASDSGYFHMFRPTNLRFFNNMAVVVRTEDERIESLKSIADSVGVVSCFDQICFIHTKMIFLKSE